MKILALESSAAACSAALCEDETLIAQFFQKSGLTHSVTLLPMADDLLRRCGWAGAGGPHRRGRRAGSFTGLRIGVSAAKGLAWPGNKPCAACSTLESMAWSLAHTGMEICPVMDARRRQVYNARFLGTGEGLERLAPDRAIALEELAAELKKSGKPQILVGDGAVLCYTALRDLGLDVRLAPPHLRQQSAWGVARCALELARRGELTDAAGLTPSYHRLSQAERERLEKEQNNKGE